MWIKTRILTNTPHWRCRKLVRFTQNRNQQVTTKQRLMCYTIQCKLKSLWISKGMLLSLFYIFVIIIVSVNVVVIVTTIIIVTTIVITTVAATTTSISYTTTSVVVVVIIITIIVTTTIIINTATTLIGSTIGSCMCIIFWLLYFYFRY